MSCDYSELGTTFCMTFSPVLVSINRLIAGCDTPHSHLIRAPRPVGETVCYFRAMRQSCRGSSQSEKRLPRQAGTETIVEQKHAKGRAREPGSPFWGIPLPHPLHTSTNHS
jgi:hypothetical protein